MRRLLLPPLRAEQAPTWLMYTNCETGFRHYTAHEGVDVSLDPRYIQYIIQRRRDQVLAVEKQAESTESLIQKIMPEPSQSVNAIMDYNKNIIEEQKSWLKRLSTAEAVLNGELVRDLMLSNSHIEAIRYTQGSGYGR